MTDEELQSNRTDMYEDLISNKLITDDYWQDRIPDHTKIKIPILSSANWGGQALHSQEVILKALTKLLQRKSGLKFMD